MARRRRLWRLAEGAAWAVGVGCLAAWGALRAGAEAGARQELARFAAFQDARSSPWNGEAVAMPDLSLWDDDRIAAWRNTLADPPPPPLAVLRIPRIGLEVPVLRGTTEWALNRAVGHIEGTAAPGADGNSAIAGHRDGFFRALKNLEAGDVIEVETLGGKEVYHVERLWVVAPEDVWVLDSTPTRSLTLVTCYPFYHVGPAPLRYIVRAVRAGDGAVDPATVAR
jgi:sortase A